MKTVHTHPFLTDTTFADGFIGRRSFESMKATGIVRRIDERDIIGQALNPLETLELF